jgi:hypothetical protein
MSRPTAGLIARPRLVPVLLVLVGLALVQVGAATWGVREVRADEGRKVLLPLAAGKALEGVVESADAREVVVRVGPEERRRIPWEQLAPLGVYRAREALEPPADGEARRRLAELAADLGLYAQARAEYEKALALGALPQKEFDALVAAAEEAAVAQGVESARRRAEAGDVAGALEIARELKLAFGAAPNAARIRALIEGLLEQVRAEDEAAAKDAAELARLEQQARRAKELLERRTRAEERLAAGNEAAKRSADSRAQGAVSRARKAAEEADLAYTEARKQLGRLRRIAPADETALREHVAARLNELDRVQLALRLAMAKYFVAPGARNYGQAEIWAAKAAYIDPVHPELLELRETIVASRIRYRISDVTNARPIVR